MPIEAIEDFAEDIPAPPGTKNPNDFFALRVEVKFLQEVNFLALFQQEGVVLGGDLRGVWRDAVHEPVHY